MKWLLPVFLGLVVLLVGVGLWWTHPAPDLGGERVLPELRDSRGAGSSPVPGAARSADSEWTRDGSPEATVLARREDRAPFALLPPLGLLDTVILHREALRDLLKESGWNSVQGRRLAVLLERGVGGREVDERFLVDALFRLGRYPGGGAADTGFVEPDVVVVTLVAAAGGADREIRPRALSYLLDHTRDAQLARHAEALREGARRHRSADEIRLLARLPLREDERLQLLRRTRTPEIRARLGDSVAEQEILEGFSAADTFREKARWSRKLGYAATAACARALLRNLTTDIVWNAPVETVSARRDILMALAVIHPDEPVFTTELRRLLARGDDHFGGRDKVQEYLRSVCSWAKHEYQINLDWQRIDPLIHRKKVIARH